MVYLETIDASDIDRLGELHVAALPHSLVSLLGRRYAKAFYRYIVRSQQEILGVVRNSAGSVNAALVVSLCPSTLEARLACSTPLLPSMLIRAPRLPLRQMAREFLRPDRSGTDERPELIIVFTDGRCRGRGIGRSLVRLCEASLKERRLHSYIVKTESVPENDALNFYTRLGFRPLHQVRKFGVGFQIFEKDLDTDAGVHEDVDPQ
jgi:ribosomal protein S18 acetylase RimI-like enzyme